MHGRVKSKLNDEQEAREKEEESEKAKIYYDSFKEIIEKKNDISQHDQVLKVIAELLIQNPDIYTLWNIRRTILLNKHNLLTSDEFIEICKTENKLIEASLASNPKSYSCWHHRAWVLTLMPNADWKRELDLSSKFLNYDQRNFHCWDHRRFVANKYQSQINSNAEENRQNDIILDSELDYTLKKIEQNFSNYSAWHYRSVLWEEKVKMARELEKKDGEKSPQDALIQDITSKDSLILINAIYTDPYDQSAWFYLHWLIFHLNKPELDNKDCDMDKDKDNHFFSSFFPNPNPMNRFSVATNFIDSSRNRGEIKSTMANETRLSMPIVNEKFSPAEENSDSMISSIINENMSEKKMEAMPINVIVSENQTYNLGQGDAQNGSMDDFRFPHIKVIYVNRADPSLICITLSHFVKRMKYLNNFDDQLEHEISDDLRRDGSYRADKTFYFNFILNEGKVYDSELLECSPVYRKWDKICGKGSSLNIFPTDLWLIRNLNNDWTSLVDEDYKFSFRYLVPSTHDVVDNFYAFDQRCIDLIMPSDKDHVLYLYKWSIPMIGLEEKLLKYQDLLFEQMNTCKELIQLEPNNKWSMLTWVFLADRLNELKFRIPSADQNVAENENEMGFSLNARNEILEDILIYLDKLADHIDPDRKGFYQSMKSKYLIREQFWQNKLTLSSRDHHHQDDTNKLCLNRFNLTHMAVPENPRILTCLKVLIVDDNIITSCAGLKDCLLLNHLSIKNNDIKQLEEGLEDISTCSYLKILVLKGNPICHSAHFPEELYCLYPNTLGTLNDYSD
ncbi:geranylgeranyl transferase type-2 subunit alpha-like isoform X2 [Gordionus sp. m RMFG-2023]|uniref:geranylgeranyl transferase type-2 subunit alpha-like isoform X2 n=1 Tax=Gordionus sp. m RMFG-2023 TaxID=3053472 RepID=UPI0031FBD655